MVDINASGRGWITMSGSEVDRYSFVALRIPDLWQEVESIELQDNHF